MSGPTKAKSGAQDVDTGAAASWNKAMDLLAATLDNASSAYKKGGGIASSTVDDIKAHVKLVCTFLEEIPIDTRLGALVLLVRAAVATVIMTKGSRLSISTVKIVTDKLYTFFTQLPYDAKYDPVVLHALELVILSLFLVTQKYVFAFTTHEVITVIQFLTTITYL